MSAAEVLSELENKGIRIEAVGTKLVWQAKTGTFTAELRAKVLENKPDLLAELTERRRTAWRDAFEERVAIMVADGMTEADAARLAEADTARRLGPREAP